MARVLLIDDDDNLREVVQFILADAGHEVAVAADGEEGLQLLAEDPDVVISDVRMPRIDGMQFLSKVMEGNSGDDAPPVIILTAHGTVAQAVEAMRLGAFTYLLKPFAREELTATVSQAARTSALQRDNRRLRDLLKRNRDVSGLVYTSGIMGQMVKDLKKVAISGAPVLVRGESGTGKELVTRACHDLSDRWDKPFIVVNCGAIPGQLMESELFGHVRGAFTGADRAVAGRIRSVNGGTLFLDEIGELPLDLQPKLLRVIETGLVDPVGAAEPVPVDFRLVCATHQDLERAASEGRFREDLLYRINVLPLDIPPLRERREDIGLLWEHFSRLHAGKTVNTAPEVISDLKSRPWSGNVRELRNLNQRLILMRAGDEISMADLSRLSPAGGLIDAAAHESGGRDIPLGPLPPDGLSLVELEKEVIRRALAMCDGNRTRAAAFLEIPRHVLVYRLQKYELG